MSSEARPDGAEHAEVPLTDRTREATEEAAYADFAEWARTDPEEVAIHHAERARRARQTGE